MPDETPPEILGSLPRTRPHRRSDKRGEPGRANAGETASAKRGARAGSDRPKTAARSDRPKPARPAQRRAPRSERLRQPQQPSGAPPVPGRRRPVPASGTELVSTVVQATAELAEIGLSLSARALRGAIGRLPRP